MPSARNVAQGRRRLSSLIAFALRDGWTVSRTAGGRIVLSRAGLPAIFIGFPCDRDDHNPALLRRRKADTRGNRWWRGISHG